MRLLTATLTTLSLALLVPTADAQTAPSAFRRAFERVQARNAQKKPMRQEASVTTPSSGVRQMGQEGRIRRQRPAKALQNKSTVSTDGVRQAKQGAKQDAKKNKGNQVVRVKALREQTKAKHSKRLRAAAKSLKTKVLRQRQQAADAAKVAKNSKRDAQRARAGKVLKQRAQSTGKVKVVRRSR